MPEYTEKEMRETLDKLRSQVERMKAAYCPEKYPYVQSIDADKQQHPEFRRGGINACDAVLRRITNIETELFSPELQKSHTTRCKLQSAPVHQCCKDTHSLQNQEGHEPADQLQGCKSQCAQKRCKCHLLKGSQSSHDAH